MIVNVPVPPVPDLARVDSSSPEAAFKWLCDYYNREIIPWSYRTGTRSVKASYRGFHNLEQLIQGCLCERIKQSRLSNEEVVRLAAPLAFGRSTQVFDLASSRFSFGRDHKPAYRIPFFFVEDRVVKLYFLQPRKSASLSFDELCMVATIHKRYLLDTEFYGLDSDVEYVDLSADPETQLRDVKRYSLGELSLWDEDRLAHKLTIIADAIDQIRKADVITRKRRIIRRPDADMPLFD